MQVYWVDSETGDSGGERANLKNIQKVFTKVNGNASRTRLSRLLRVLIQRVHLSQCTQGLQYGNLG